MFFGTSFTGEATTLAFSTFDDVERTAGFAGRGDGDDEGDRRFDCRSGSGGFFFGGGAGPYCRSSMDDSLFL